jgi:glycosyltransferase involved in cell wall biosynthesis
MKILMISAGLTPKRSGGLIAYVEEVMEGLASRGHEIVYLDMNGKSILPFTSCRREERNYTKYTISNSAVYIDGMLGTYEPLKQVYPSRRLKSLIRQVVQRERPDIIHIHELLGFPVALLETLKQENQKIVFTAHDYYSLCPTVKLFRHDLKNCWLANDELICKACCLDARFSWAVGADDVVRQIAASVGRGSRLWHLVRRNIRTLSRIIHHRFVSPRDYIVRRAEFMKYLSRVDAIVAVSRLQLSTMKAALGEQPNLRYMYLSRETFAEKPIKKTSSQRISNKVVFVALNVNTPAKGSLLLERVFSELEQEHDNFELRIYGADGRDTKRVKYFGKYGSADLDKIVSSADFGIVPSLWRESYGYVGSEMLSRGLPLIVSSTGAMVEYVEDGENGFIFDPEKEGSLKSIVKRLITSKSLRSEISDSTLQSNNPFKRFDKHLSDVESLYSEIRDRTA